MDDYAHLHEHIVDEIVRPLAGLSIHECFPPEFAAQLVACPGTVKVGWSYDGNNFSPPPAKDLAQLKAEKLQTLQILRLRALAGAIALADPSPVNVAIESALWAAEDADGLHYLQQRVQKEYTQLAEALHKAATADELHAVQLQFNI